MFWGCNVSQKIYDTYALYVLTITFQIEIAIFQGDYRSRFEGDYRPPWPSGQGWHTPAPLEAGGVGSIPANSDAQHVPSFSHWGFEIELSPYQPCKYLNGCIDYIIYYIMHSSYIMLHLQLHILHSTLPLYNNTHYMRYYTNYCMKHYITCYIT